MIDLKKISDEIAEKCGAKDASVNVYAHGRSDVDLPSLSILVSIGRRDYHDELPEITQEAISEAAHACAEVDLLEKEKREKAQIEAARALLAKHGEVSS